MKQGFVKVATVTPKNCSCGYEREHCVNLRRDQKAEQEGQRSLCSRNSALRVIRAVTFFYRKKVGREARQSLLEIAAFTFALDCIVFVGLPPRIQRKAL